MRAGGPAPLDVLQQARGGGAARLHGRRGARHEDHGRGARPQPVLRRQVAHAQPGEVRHVPQPPEGGGPDGAHGHLLDRARPPTSRPAKQNPRFPYLLRGKRVGFPNQVWSTDITYIPLGRCHVYLSAVIDWHSRYIVGWRLHDTLEARECVACMERAFDEHGTPAVANSDQGSTYSSAEYVECLRHRGVEQSMDGKGRWADNVYVERWFRDLKHYCIYQREYSTFGELRRLIAEYVDNYNNRKLHGSLGYETPASWYYSGLNSRDSAELPLAA